MLLCSPPHVACGEQHHLLPSPLPCPASNWSFDQHVVGYSTNRSKSNLYALFGYSSRNCVKNRVILLGGSDVFVEYDTLQSIHVCRSYKTEGNTWSRAFCSYYVWMPQQFLYTPGHFPVQRTITKEEGETSPQVATQTQGEIPRIMYPHASWTPTHHEPPRIMNPDCGSPVSHVWPPTHKTTLLPGARRLLRTASQICPPLKSQMLRLSYVRTYVRTGMLIHVYRHAIDTKWACMYVWAD